MAGDDLRHPRFARFYLRFAEQADDAGQREHRRRLLEGVHGRVIEIGAGGGLNLPHYPPEVDEVHAVEPEPDLRAHLEQVAATAPVPVRVTGGRAERLPAPDGAYDAAIASLVLCSVLDPQAALAEIRRVLRPGGELRFYEHVRAEGRLLAGVQHVAALVQPRLFGGCHPDRDTVGAIEAAGFELVALERFRYQPAWYAATVAPHVLGVARS